MNVIAEKIHLIESLSPNKGATVRLLDKVIHCRAEEERRKQSALRKKLREFEARYALTTVEFQERFDSGELGDSTDFFEWNGVVDIAARLDEKLAALRETDRV